MFKLIPQPDNVPTFYHECICGGLRMAFDPTKSPHYKVIYAQRMRDSWVRIQTYSSETGNWNLCGDQFPERCLRWFQDGVYWNDAIYWISPLDNFVKLDIMNEHPVLTALRTPLALDGKVHYIYRLFESRGSLLLVGKANSYSLQYTVYEKVNLHSEWSMKYKVNLDDIIAERQNIRDQKFYIVLGEREEDYFLVMQLNKKVVQYKIASKTLSTISDLGPNERLDSCFSFIPSFANV